MKLPNPDQLAGPPATIMNHRDGTSQVKQFYVRDIILALEGVCPLCRGPLRIEPLGEGYRAELMVGKCNSCWVAFLASVKPIDGGRHWDLETIELIGPNGEGGPTKSVKGEKR
jgi:hypothetical protein